MSVEDDLGPLTRTYRTNDRRRRKRALVPFVVGGVSGLATVGWAVEEKKRIEQAGGVEVTILAPTIVAVSLFLLGAAFLVVYLCTRGEEFHLYEHGLVRQARNRRDVVWWGDIAGVEPIWSQSLLLWVWGGEAGCKVRLTTGQEMYITGFTEGVAQLRRDVTDRVGN